MVSVAQEYVESVSSERSLSDILELLEEGNIANRFSMEDGQKLIDLENDASNSMHEWLESYKKAIRLAKLQPREKNKTFPFEGASTAMAPFILEAMIDFNSRSAPELAYSDNIVKAKVYGGMELPPEPPSPEQAGIQGELLEIATQDYNRAMADRQAAQDRIDTQKEDRADRVTEYCNYQLSEFMPGWKRAQDKMLLSLPCIGTMYKKTYYDYNEQETCSDLLYGDEVIFDHNYPLFEDAPDKFINMPPLTRNEVMERIRGVDEWVIDSV